MVGDDDARLGIGFRHYWTDGILFVDCCFPDRDGVRPQRRHDQWSTVVVVVTVVIVVAAAERAARTAADGGGWRGRIVSCSARYCGGTTREVSGKKEWLVSVGCVNYFEKMNVLSSQLA